MFIARATGSPFSHTGIVAIEDGSPVVYDCSSDGIQRQPFEVWMLDCVGAIGVKRLKPEQRRHIPGVIGYCRKVFEQQVPFDFEFRLDDAALYCLELTEKAFRSQGLALSEPVRIGDWEHLTNYPLTALAIPLVIGAGARAPDHPRAARLLARERAPRRVGLTLAGDGLRPGTEVGPGGCSRTGRRPRRAGGSRDGRLRRRRVAPLLLGAPRSMDLPSRSAPEGPGTARSPRSWRTGKQPAVSMRGTDVQTTDRRSPAQDEGQAIREGTAEAADRAVPAAGLGRARGVEDRGLFEGRDAAGKGGTIKAITERVSPRVFRLVALPAPSDREKTQLYVQRYMQHFPAAGEVVIFDRSWYNRAGVEYVMGFCTKEQYESFWRTAPKPKSSSRGRDHAHQVLAGSRPEGAGAAFRGPHRRPAAAMETQPDGRGVVDPLVRLFSRRDRMLEATDTEDAPWYIVRSDDKRRAA